MTLVALTGWLGAIALTVNGFAHGALPSAALNVVWLAIAGKALHSAS